MASTSDDELEYLSPSFDPASLTIPKLRSILVSHDIPYPASAKKSQLIEIFNVQLAPKSRKILAARSRTKRTSRGITDMPSSQEGTVDGEAEDNGLMPPPPVPDTSRRRTKSTRASTEETADESTPAKRVSSGRKSAVKHPRASDSEGGLDLETKRPVGRKSRKSEITPTVKAEEPETPPTRPGLEPSPFSHENPFQSGSSPLAPGESRRKSAGTSTDRRKSSSRRRTADARSSAETTVVKQQDGTVVPSSKTFEVPIAKLRDRKVKREPEPEPEDTIQAGEEFTAEEQLELVRERAANGEVDILPPRRVKRATRSSGISKSAPWIVLTTILTGYAAWFRKEKIEVGYCGLGKPSTTLANVEIPEWASILQPQCELCPQHAYCYADMEARCEPDFVLKPHPLSLGGLIPLPPSCEPDGEKVRKIKAVADKAVEELRERRAKWECGDLVEKNGKPASSVEIETSTLKAEVSQKRRKGMSEAEFEALWEGALGEIIGRDEVTSDGTRHQNTHRLASTSLARLPLACSLRRSLRLALARHRLPLSLLTLLISLSLYAHRRFLTSRADKARIPALVATTLDRLATQAALHARGDSDEAFISVSQMRDDVLREVFDMKRRARIWRGVEAVVGGNANVRTGVREGRGGEVGRVWEWIGSVRGLEGGRGGRRSLEGGERRSLGPEVGIADGVSPEADGVAGRRWDEGRPIY
ncbi:inner nuclear membrane protein enriched at telomere/subtelomere region [Lambiella insularis]|nr:inner nuclear membrane protein enriched at telomere/subtelomere region [Lambiella insularis]